MRGDLGETSYRGVRVLVLGATGFIGRWVARKLVQQEARVYLTVRDAARVQEVFRRYAIQAEILPLDLDDRSAISGAVEKARPSITFNLAGYGVDPLETDREAAYRINARLVAAAAEAVSQQKDLQWPGQHLIQAGSTAEYGAIGGNLSEDSHPQPTTLYGQSKLAGTQALERCSQNLGINALTARLFAVYGPGERLGRLLPQLLRTAQTGETLELTTGEQLRDFTYVEDVAEGLLRLGLAEADPGTVVNLATGKLTSVRRFVETAAGVLNIPSQCLQFGAIPRPQREKDWDMEPVPVSVQRLQQLTGWLPATDVPEGIARTRDFADKMSAGPEGC